MLPQRCKYEFGKIGGNMRIICQWEYRSRQHLFIGKPDCFNKINKYAPKLRALQQLLLNEANDSNELSAKIRAVKQKIHKYTKLLTYPNKCGRRTMRQQGITCHDCVVRMSGEQLVYSHYIRNGVARFAYFYGKFRLWQHANSEDLNSKWVELIYQRHQLAIIPDFDKGHVLEISIRCGFIASAITAPMGERMIDNSIKRYCSAIEPLDIRMYDDYLKLLIAKDALQNLMQIIVYAVDECNDAFIAVQMDN